MTSYYDFKPCFNLGYFAAPFCLTSIHRDDAERRFTHWPTTMKATHA